MHLTRRIGFEIELLAPPGASRRTLADELASRCGGQVRQTFHLGSEPSPVPGVDVFHHLTPGFEVTDAAGTPVASLVDDETLVADLAGAKAGSTDWYRVICDDLRLIHLVELHSDPEEPLEKVLEPVAALFGAPTEILPDAVRVGVAGATVAMGVPLPPGRERPCEIVTPPIGADHLPALERLLGPARDLGFTVPAEAAVHLHLDGGPFRDVRAFANLVRLFGHWRDGLWALLGTNPECRRLAPLPPSLLDLAEDPPPARPDGWARLQRAAKGTGVGKYHDVNLANLLTNAPVRDTVEVRILPGTVHGEDVVERAALVEALLDLCRHEAPVPVPAASGAVATARELLALVESRL